MISELIRQSSEESNRDRPLREESSLYRDKSSRRLYATKTGLAIARDQFENLLIETDLHKELSLKEARNFNQRINTRLRCFSLLRSSHDFPEEKVGGKKKRKKRCRCQCLAAVIATAELNKKKRTRREQEGMKDRREREERTSKKRKPSYESDPPLDFSPLSFPFLPFSPPDDK